MIHNTCRLSLDTLTYNFYSRIGDEENLFNRASKIQKRLNCDKYLKDNNKFPFFYMITLTLKYNRTKSNQLSRIYRKQPRKQIDKSAKQRWSTFYKKPKIVSSLSLIAKTSAKKANGTIKNAKILFVTFMHLVRSVCWTCKPAINM